MMFLVFRLLVIWKAYMGCTWQEHGAMGACIRLQYQYNALGMRNNMMVSYMPTVEL